MVERVVASEESKKTVELLKEQYGDLIFFQSSGCCDASTPCLTPETSTQLAQAIFRLALLVKFHTSCLNLSMNI